jgi:hypothetical protein
MNTMKAFSLFKPLALVLMLMLSINANAQKEKLQTALIYQLTRLVEWCPEGKQGNFVVAIVGNEPALLNELLALQVRRVATQQIEVKNFATIADITKANILFVPESLFDKVDQIAAKAGGSCTMIISDKYGSARRGAGADISLVYNTRVSKLELEINRGNMRNKGFNVNDQLYNLATNIY